MFRLKFCLFFTITVVSSCLQAQQSYLKLPEKYIGNAAIIDQGAEINCRTCCVIENNAYVYYRPEQVIEYRLNDGRKYVTREADQGNGREAVFMEVIVEGEMSLFRYIAAKKTFFYLEVDSTLYAVPADRDLATVEERTELLKEAASKKHETSKLGLYVGYRQHDLEGFAKRYNEDDYRILINSRICFSAGISRTSLAVSKSDYYNRIHSIYPGNSVFGSVALDIPILFSPFSYHPDLTFNSRIPDDSISRMNSIIVSLGKFRANARLGNVLVYGQFGSGFGYISGSSDIRILNFKYRLPFLSTLNAGIGMTYEPGPFSFSLTYDFITQTIDALDLWAIHSMNNISLSINF